MKKENLLFLNLISIGGTMYILLPPSPPPPTPSHARSALKWGGEEA